jgi:diguanylate cyclase (GGDEF)-like protein
MKLRSIIVLDCALITVLLTLGMMLVIQRVLLHSYAELENGHVTDLERSRKALQAEIDSVDLSLRDYSTWNGTYEFVRRPTAKYGLENLSPVTMKNLGMRLVLIANEAGQPVFLQSYRSYSPEYASPSHTEELRRLAEFARSQNPDAGVKGIVELSDGPALVAARRVLKTSGEGPPQGVMVMVRELDYKLLAMLSSHLLVPVSLTEVETTLNGFPALPAGQDFVIREMDSATIAGYVLLNDVWAKPRFSLRIGHDRDIWNEGVRAGRAMKIAIVIMGAMFCGFILGGAKLHILGPGEGMFGFARAFSADTSTTKRIKVRGSAEMVQLGEQINKMVDEIQASQSSLLAAREKLKFEATHDALTGTWNCCAALELLDREIARGEREGTEVAVLMLDLDHFKRVNDRFGHIVGDRVLQGVTASVAQILRSSDVLARYGGEEFLVIAPSCSGSRAKSLAERIRMRLHSTPIEIDGREVRVTTSIGVAAACFPFTSEELIAPADRALYLAKAKGRNCVVYEDAAPSRVKGMLYSMPGREV